MDVSGISSKDINWSASILQAIEDDDENLLEMLLDLPIVMAAVVMTNNEASAEVLCAIDKCKPCYLEMLLEKGANPNASNSKQSAIHKAMETGNEEMVDLLCKHNANLNVLDGNGQSAVHYAVYYQNLPLLLTLIYYNADLNITDNNGQTALHYAVYNGNLLFSRTLIMAKANTDICDQTGKSPLFVAIWKGNTDIIKLLLINKATTDTTAMVSFPPHYIAEVVTPVMYAAAIGQSEGLELMLESGGDAHLGMNRDGRSALFYASLFNHEHCVDVIRRKSNMELELMNACEQKDVNYVKLLLEWKPDLNKTDELGETVVTKAATHGCLGMLINLVEAGAEVDPNLDREYGKTPLMVAAGNGREDCLKELLKRNASIDRANEYGQTALWFAAKLGKTECIRTLLEAGANVNLASKTGTPLMAAVGKLESFKVLLDHCCDVNYVNAKRDCVLTLVMQQKCDEQFNLLMNCKQLEVNIIDGKGWSPVMVATSMKQLERLKVLLDCGAKVDHSNSQGTTALHLAASKRFSSGMELLLSHKQDLNVSMKKGGRSTRLKWSPLTMAIKANARDCVVQLLKHGAVAFVPQRFSLHTVMTRRFQPKLVKALHAAGANPDSLPDIVYRGDNRKPVPLWVQYNRDPNHPTDLHDQDHDNSLFNLCRLKIRQHLLEVRRCNLFHSVPQLQLPRIIQAYLLFNIELDKL